MIEERQEFLEGLEDPDGSGSHVLDPTPKRAFARDDVGAQL